MRGVTVVALAFVVAGCTDSHADPEPVVEDKPPVEPHQSIGEPAWGSYEGSSSDEPREAPPLEPPPTFEHFEPQPAPPVVCEMPSMPTSCGRLGLPAARPVSGCAQPMPPDRSNAACAVAEIGAVYYVSASHGADTNDGTSPERAFGSLCNAVARVPAGSTLRVAAGEYLEAEIGIDKPIVVKAGYDETFDSWDPDAHPALFPGRLVLAHDGAVWAGFQMISSPHGLGDFGAGQWQHRVAAGSMVRNYVEIDFSGDAYSYYFSGIVAASCPGSTSRLACNDIYVHATKPISDLPADSVSFEAIEYGNTALHAGESLIERNRVCVDGADWRSSIVSGYGTCSPAVEPGRVALTNNVLELTGHDAWSTSGVHFYGCGEEDLHVTLAHNTIVGATYAVSGYGSGDGRDVVHFRLANNVLIGSAIAASQGRSVDLSSGGTSIDESRGTLAIGFATGMTPAPISSEGDVTYSASEALDPTFVPIVGGPADGTAVALSGEWGDIATDLLGRPRSGAADRGAVEN